MVEIQRLQDDELKQHLWNGWVEFILKYRRVKDFERFLETLLPWIERIEIESGTNYVKVVLEYVLNGLEVEDEELFLEKSDLYLSEKLRSEVMTLAQRNAETLLARGERVLTVDTLDEVLNSES